MLTEHTLIQILSQPDPTHAPERARELGQLGFMQWLGGLPGDTAYDAQAHRALHLALPFVGTGPAMAEFCRLVSASLEGPHVPLDLAMPPNRRRGGARMRRA